MTTYVPTYKTFPFRNNLTRDSAALEAAFKEHEGLSVVDVQREMIGMMTWVLASDGSLWLHD